MTAVRILQHVHAIKHWFYFPRYPIPAFKYRFLLSSTILCSYRVFCFWNPFTSRCKDHITTLDISAYPFCQGPSTGRSTAVLLENWYRTVDQMRPISSAGATTTLWNLAGNIFCALIRLIRHANIWFWYSNLSHKFEWMRINQLYSQLYAALISFG